MDTPPLDSLDWARKYDILSVSRLVLRDQLGFSTEQVSSLTDDDMQAIADTVRENMLYATDFNALEEIKFVTSVFFVTTHTNNQTGGQDGE